MAKTKSGRAGVPILQRRLCSGVGHSNFKLEHPTPALFYVFQQAANWTV